MATKKPAAKANTDLGAELHIPPLKQGIAKLRIIGVTPMFQHRMAGKAKHTLFVGSRPKTSTEKAAIKHDPIQEYLDSAEIMPSGPTALGLRVTAVKDAMCTAALETAGVTKTATQRLLFMPGDLVPLYGTPQLRLDVVRQAGMNKTPDIRSRAYIPRWAAEITIKFVTPQLSITSVVALLGNAGILVGVGDFRQEKGKGSFGSFRVIADGDQDDEWDELVANHGRASQTRALENPEFADAETAEMMEFYFGEVKRRAA